MPRRKVTKPVTKAYADKIDNYIKSKIEPELGREVTFQDFIEDMIKASTYNKVDDAFDVLTEAWKKTGREITDLEFTYKKYFFKNKKMEGNKSQINNKKDRDYTSLIISLIIFLVGITILFFNVKKLMDFFTIKKFFERALNLFFGIVLFFLGGLSIVDNLNILKKPLIENKKINKNFGLFFWGFLTIMPAITCVYLPFSNKNLQFDLIVISVRDSFIKLILFGFGIYLFYLAFKLINIYLKKANDQ